VTPARDDQTARLAQARLLVKLFAKEHGDAKSLAREIGASEATLSAWRHGRRVPSPTMLERLRLAVRGRVRVD
jgi:transcriptional regulator with XRE-family HTH domain